MPKHTSYNLHLQWHCPRMLWSSGACTSICLTWGGGGVLLPLRLRGMGGSLWCVISSGHAWVLKEQRQPCSVSLQTIYTRLNVSHDSTKNSKQVRNCQRSLSPWACSPAGFGVQLADGLLDFDGSPSPEAQSPPGGHSSILVGWSVGACQTDYKLVYGLRSFKKGKCIRLAEVGVQFNLYVSLLTWSHDVRP